MGYDITFHPVSAAELQRFVFDVLDDPLLGASRAAEVTRDPESRELIESLYADLPAVLARPEEMGSLGVVCACVAGFLHPYWYSRGHALSFLVRPEIPESATLFTPLPKIARPGRLSTIEDPTRGRITGNWTGSGFIEPVNLPRIDSILSASTRPPKSSKPSTNDRFDEESLDSLHRAVAYAQSHDLGLLEATDVVMPIADSCHSNLANLRAHFLSRLDP